MIKRVFSNILGIKVYLKLFTIVGFIMIMITLIIQEFRFSILSLKIREQKEIIDEQDETIIKLWESNNKLWGHTMYNYQRMEEFNKSFDKLNKRVHELHRYIYEQSKIQEKLLEKVGKNLDHIKK